MMMPANFSAVSENEMTYVMGGSVADYLAPVMKAAQWQQFSKNLVTIIGNKYLNSFVNNTLGVVFTGSYVPGQVFSTVTGALGYKYQTGSNAIVSQNKFLRGANGVLNAALDVVGNLAAIYNLGFGTVDNAAKGAKIA